jgi:hypothetical protein
MKKTALLLIVVCLVPFASAQKTRSTKLHINIMNNPSGPPDLNLEGTRVPYREALQKLGNLATKRGHTLTVIVGVEDGLSIADLQNMRGIIDKAGFSDVHYFVFGADHRNAGEIIFGKVIPYAALTVTD